MSTKTTLKRVALVAVAATGFGLMSALPSSATSQADTLTASTTASSTTSAVAVTNTITSSFLATNAADQMTVTASIVSMPAGNAVLPSFTAGVASGTGASGGTPGLVVTNTATGGAGVSTVAFTASFAPVVSGTYVVKFTPSITGGLPTLGTLNSAAILWTVTVAATPVVTVANSTSYIAIGAAVAPVVPAVDDVVAAPKAANTALGSQVATIKVTSNNNVPTNLSTTTTLSATITGPGTLGFGGNSGVNDLAVGAIPSSGRAITGAIGQNLIAVFSDGTSGTAKITISAGTLVLAEETVVFYGAISQIASTVVNPVIATSTVITNAEIGAITAIAKDSNGNAVAGANLYITSSDLTVLNASYLVGTGVSDGTGKVTFNLPVGLKAGSVNLVVGNGTDAATTTISAAAVAVRVGTETPAAVTVMFDKNAYVLGEAATVTVALVDAAGLPVADGAYTNVFAAGGMVSNFALSGTPINVIAITTTKSTGTMTFAVNMPVFAADVVLSYTADTSLPLAARVAGTSSTASVSNSSSDAATDAANAATDAANYAADAADAATTAAEEATAAAQAAQESADAATAAVVELSTKVSALVDSLRAQITSLGNYVAKVAAALGRVGTALNKVLAKK